MFASKKLTAYEILQCLYVDDGAFPFGTREDLKNGMELIPPLWQIWIGNAHWMRDITVQNQMCLLPPPHSSSNTPSIALQLPQQSNKPSIAPTLVLTLWNTPTKLELPHRLPCQMPCHCHFNPF